MVATIHNLEEHNQARLDQSHKMGEAWDSLPFIKRLELEALMLWLFSGAPQSYENDVIQEDFTI